MRLLSLTVALLALLNLAIAAPIHHTEVVASRRILNLHSHYQQNTLATIRHRTTGCTPSTIQHRKEWFVSLLLFLPSSLTPRRTTLNTTTQKSFISAIYCLAALPALTPPTHAPGARFLYDDFIVTHIDQTPFVHASGLFLPWHRQFLHLFAASLSQQCGYTGPLPYWDWTGSFSDPRTAAVFDGSETSLGGNGKFVAGRNHTRIELPGGREMLIPPATGGGCVEKGPFAEGRWEIRLGPVGYEPMGPDGGMGYNPRCLTRDLSPGFSHGTRPSAVVNLVEGCKDLGCFVHEMDAPGGVPGGLHASGHWQVGLGATDVFASPSDPVFWLHHAQVDRVWAMWQGQELAKRTYEIWGTATAGNGEFASQ